MTKDNRAYIELSFERFFSNIFLDKIPPNTLDFVHRILNIGILFRIQINSRALFDELQNREMLRRRNVP